MDIYFDDKTQAIPHEPCSNPFFHPLRKKKNPNYVTVSQDSYENKKFSNLQRW